MRKLILLLGVGLWAGGPLSADVLTYTITPSSGVFVYDFTLTNTGDTGGTLFDLFLSLPTDIINIDTTTIGTPIGWGDPTGGLLIFGVDTSPTTSFIDWSADFSQLYDLGIGSSLGGFSFRSSVDVGQPITFALNGSTDFATAQEVSSVPEPGSFVLLVTMLLAVAGFQIRSRSVQTP
jgi:hypothetical protein